MVADILNEYFVKSNTQNGTFTYNGQNLSPMDTRLLSEAGFKNNCEIIVTYNIINAISLILLFM